MEYGNITHYGIWRAVNDTTSDGMGQVPAVQSAAYHFVASTINDSISTGTNWETYYITAHTASPWVYYTSARDSGYSVDNIAPFAPGALNVTIDTEGLTASWSDLNNPDIYYYEVYKDGQYFQQTAEPQFTDSFDYGSIAVYTIRGIDVHENVGEFSDPFEITNGTQGDVTWDGVINVLDILQIADIIINDGAGFSEGQLWAAELNNDGTIDIYDLLQMVDVIMGGSYARTIDTNGLVTVIQQGHTVYLSTSGSVAGLQITLSAPVDESITNLTDFTFAHNGERVLLYTMNQDVLTGERIPIIELPDGVTITTVKAGNAYGEKQTVTVTLAPETFAVHQNYPNPFNPTTAIQVDLVDKTQIAVMIYDIQGKLVQELVNTQLEAGYHRLNWDGRNSIGSPVSSGVYFIQVVTPDNLKTIKAMVLR